MGRIATAPADSRKNAREKKLDPHKFSRYKVATGSCYDSVLEEKLNVFVPKSVSFVTDKMLETQQDTKSVGQHDKTRERMREMGIVDDMIHEYFPDKASIEKFYEKMPKSYFNASQNGYFFNSHKSFQRLITGIERDGK